MAAKNSKVVPLSSLKSKVGYLKRRGKKIAFTNGCFDILHYGHVSYLEKAKAKNRILIVGLNSDKSIQKIKGKKRPIVEQKYRAGLLSALSCVDYIVIFNDETPYKVIKALKPDILIKGADWRGKQVVGADIVKANRGKVELIRYIPNLSTTKIIQTIRRKCR